jgi:hypothetical protein
MFGGAIKCGDSQMKYAILQNCSFVTDRRDNFQILPKTQFQLFIQSTKVPLSFPTPPSRENFRIKSLTPALQLTQIVLYIAIEETKKNSF